MQKLFLLCVVGIITIVSGTIAEGKLKGAKQQFKTEADLVEAFNLFDEFGEGKLSPGKIKQMLNTYDPPTLLTDAELTAINMLDSDHNGSIEVAELVRWYHGKGTSENSVQQETMKTESNISILNRIYKGVMLLSAVAGLSLLLLGSVVSTISHVSSKSFSMFSVGRIVLDFCIASCSLLGLFVELHVRVRSISFVQNGR